MNRRQRDLFLPHALAFTLVALLLSGCGGSSSAVGDIGDFNHDGATDIALACSDIDLPYFGNSADPGLLTQPAAVLENQ